ncbi:MAG: glycosyltransferase family 9 protein [Elusimicrobiota bacterium]
MDFLCEEPAAQLLRANPGINEVITYDRRRPAAMILGIRKRHYDWVVDFLGTPRTAVLTALSGALIRAGSERVFHRWAYNRRLKHPEFHCYVGTEKTLLLKTLGVRAQEKNIPRIAVPCPSSEFAEIFYQKIGISRSDIVITVSPTSRRHFNRWPLERYAQLCERLYKQWGAKTVIVWGPGEKAQAESVVRMVGKNAVLAPQTATLLDLAAVLMRATLHIGNDNGTKHIAAAIGAPTFTIFGPHNPISWTPPNPDRHRFIQKNCLCRGDSKKEKACAAVRCLDLISTEDAEREIGQFLSAIVAAEKKDARSA